MSNLTPEQEAHEMNPQYMTYERIASLKQYLADCESGMNQHAAWQNHKARMQALTSQALQHPHLIFCGSPETMRAVTEKGALGLNPIAHKWQVISKTAHYNIVTQPFTTDDGKEETMAYLYSDQDLRAIAKEKGLIV